MAGLPQKRRLKLNLQAWSSRSADAPGNRAVSLNPACSASLRPPDFASELSLLAQQRSDACIHSALRRRGCIARRALMGFALLTLITFAA